MIEEKFMHRALQLAKLGAGTTASNPMVGAVVVKNGEIISEGYHKIFGGAHAEVEALYHLNEQQCENAVLYVTLEPCNHHGKTPPCTDLILQKKINHVVVAMKDPNPLVSGKGIERLLNHQVSITEGILEKEARELNKAFVKQMTTGLPYVILKWAESADGFMGSGDIPDLTAGQISGPLSRQLVHKWRTETQALLTTFATVIADNPQLNVRYWTGPQPLRVLIDPDLKIDDRYALMNDHGPTLVFNQTFQGNKNNVRFIKPQDLEMGTILRKLGSMGISTIMTETGPRTLNKLIESGLWDEARVFTSPHTLGKGIAAPKLNAAIESILPIGKDQLKIYKKI